MKSGDDINDIKEVTEEVEALLRPEPNKKNTWDVRWALGYYKGTQEKPGFINRFLNKKNWEKNPSILVK